MLPIFRGDHAYCLLHGVRIERDAACPQCLSNATPMTDEQRRKFIESAGRSALGVQADTDAKK